MDRLNTIVRTAALAIIASIAASFAHAQAQPKGQQPTAPPTNHYGPNATPWFGNQQMRDQLKFNDNQYNSLNKSYQKSWEGYQKGINGIDPNLSPAQRLQRMNELQQNFYDDFATSRDMHIKDPAQRQRFDQLHWQYRGYGAFSDPFVANKLQITPAQRAKMNEAQQEWTAQMNKLEPLYQKNPEQVSGQFSKLQAQNAAQMNSILTPTQRQMWQQMTGTSYNFGPDAYFRPNTTTPSGKK